jgi:hypothetical protein
MFSNGNSFNGGSNYCFGPLDDPQLRTMAWLFRRQIPAIP